MRHTLKFILFVMCVLAISVRVCDARGGRRGGGSLGGLFGGWRKYKKPSSSGGSSRRSSLNNSPMQTPITKTTSPFGSMAASKKSHTQSHASYPRQQTHRGAAADTAGYYPHGGYHHGYGGGQTYVPPGGTYYANAAAIPPGAVYYAQPPVHSSGGDGNFFLGMMAGHLLFGNHHTHHVHHIHEQNPQQPSSESGTKVIIIDNDAANAKNYWPTETDTPLAPLNSTLTPVEATPPVDAAVFPRVTTQNINALNVMPMPATALPPHAASGVGPPPPVGGIICVPMLFNVTDPIDSNETQTVEKMVCYPAPPSPPPPPSALPAGASNCITRRFIETDPSDSTKTIEVERPDCSAAAQTTPAQIIGEIGESVAVDEHAHRQPGATTITSTTRAAN